MTTPEQAVALARRAAAQMRRDGAYAELATDARGAGAPAPPDAGPPALYRWAMIEPDERDVRSTRRLGAPITALKRALLRLLAQYHAQLTAQQTRFNVALLGHIESLEARVAELEQRLAGPDAPRSDRRASAPARRDEPVDAGGRRDQPADAGGRRDQPANARACPGEPPAGTAAL